MAQDYIIDGQTLTDIGNAIREKSGTSDMLAPQAMPDAIRAISGGSVTKEEIVAALGYTPAKVDDAVFSARDAWSSQRIVDMFCPPMEEEGNPVQCWPIPGYPLGVVASWTPTQAGSGDPSADNVRPITGRSSVSIEHCGETLWNWDEVTATGYNNSVQQYLDMDRINALPRNTSLYLSGSITGASGAGKFEMGFYTAGYAKTLGTLRSNGTPSTVIQDGEIAIVHLTGGENSSASRTFHDLQISLGSSAPSAYAPYSGTTKTLALPATIYGGEVDAVTGEGKKTWEIIDSYAGETLPGEWISNRDVYAVGGTPTTGAQVAYKLAEPVAFNVTGGEAVSAKAGVNTFLTNANSVKVTGKDDPIHKIQQLSYAVVSLGGNV